VTLLLFFVLLRRPAANSRASQVRLAELVGHKADVPPIVPPIVARVPIGARDALQRDTDHAIVNVDTLPTGLTNTPSAIDDNKLAQSLAVNALKSGELPSRPDTTAAASTRPLADVAAATPAPLEPYHSYDDVHVRPLTHAQRERAHDAATSGDHNPMASGDEAPVTGTGLHDSGNPLAAQYADVPDLDVHDPLQASFRGKFWRSRPLLATVLRRWVVLNREMRSRASKPRVVSVTPVGQLCNRLIAITSGFVFALITKRGLHVDDANFYCEMRDLFKEPGFDWTGVTGFGSGGSSHFIQNPEGGVWAEMEPLLCGDYSQAYTSPDVSFAINQYLVPYFTTNPHYRDHLLDLFGSDDIFTPSAHFLFRPTDQLIHDRDAYVAQHFEGKFVVGLQVRSGGDFTENFMNDHDWGLYQRCGESMVPKGSEAHLVYFVATDTAKGREAAKRILGKDRVMFGPGEFLLSNNPRGVQMALLDLLLLAASNDRVTTAWSSYGYFAAGFSGVEAGIVVDQVDPAKYIAVPGAEQRFMGVPHKSDKRRQCVRLPVHQPCFHKFASWGASQATCHKWEWFDREMLNGRYC
jgi:hypothetical protein